MTCPGCKAADSVQLVSLPSTEAPLSGYLHSFYETKGSGIESKYLAGGRFTLCQCRHCDLVYQRDVPNAELMSILYERWIDPKTAFRQHEESDGLDLYAYYAWEIKQFVWYLHSKPTHCTTWLVRWEKAVC